VYVLTANLRQDRPPDVARDAWRDISRAGLQAVAEHWHVHILPDHFTEQARYRYRHQLRGIKYGRRKAHLAAAGRPFEQGGAPVIGPQPTDNVLTGYMQQQLQSSKAITAYPTRVTLKMYGPRYMTMRVFRGDVKEAIRRGWTYGKGKKFHSGSGRDQPDKVREITTITADQMGELVGVLEQRTTELLAAYRAPRDEWIL
jgi:hypothetical protein